MRRILALATALVAVGAATVAYAQGTAINTYKAGLSFTSKAPGTAKAPLPIGFKQTITAAGTNNNRTALLTDIVTKVYGLKVDSKDFPTCSETSIENAKNDTGCPKKALVATGSITAVLGSASSFTATGAPCDPNLDVWNSGPGKLTFFFVDAAPNHECIGGAVPTGQVGPYPATYKTVGKYLVVDVPIPGYVDTPVPGQDGSLTGEILNWEKNTTKVKGKTVAAISSIACSGKTRPYSTTFTATLPVPTPAVTQTNTVTATAPC